MNSDQTFLRNSEVPSIKDELQRKAFGHLGHMAIQLESGRISEAQFETGVRAVWACVSGLVDKWLIDTISEIQDKRDASYNDYRILSNGTAVMLLHRRIGGAVVYASPLVESLKCKQWDFSDEPNPSLAALRKIDAIQKTLVRNGYTLFGER